MEYRSFVAPAFLIAIVLVGISINILREILFAVVYGTNSTIELFRLYFAIPAAVSGLVGQSFMVNASAFLLSSERPNTDGSVKVAGFVLAVILTCLYLISLPVQFEYLLSNEARYTSVSTIRIITYMSFYLFFVAIGFWVRATLLGADYKVSAASYAVILSLMPVLTIGLQCVAHGIPSTEELALHYCISSIVTFVFFKTLLFKKTSAKAVVFNKADLRLSRVYYLLCGISILSIYRLVNTVPRFFDRGVLADLQDGSVAALEYSFSIIGVPVMFLTILFLSLIHI